MNKYPQASTGIRMVLWSEIIQLIGVVIVPAVIIGVVAGTGTETGAVAGVGLGVILALVIGLVCAIISFVGMVKASKEERRFKDAYEVIIGAIIAQLLLAILNVTSILPNDGMSTTVITILDLLVTVYVLQGIRHLYESNTNISGAERCGRVSVIYTIATVLGLICTIWSNSLANSPTLAGVLGLVYIVLMLVAYIYYLRTLSKAWKDFR